MIRFLLSSSVMAVLSAVGVLEAQTTLFHYRVNSIIDYAGTEKIRIPSGLGYSLDMSFDSGSGNHILEGVPTAAEGHYVAMVFEHDGGFEVGGQISGTMTWYDDGTTAAGSEPATKADFGDSLNRVIGVGRHPSSAPWSSPTTD